MKWKNPVEPSESVLWRLLKPPPGTYIRYFAKKDGLTTGGVIRDEEHMRKLAQTFADQKWDAYIQLNPTWDSKKKRASASDVSHYRWFSMDVDPINPYAEVEDARLIVPAPLMDLQDSNFVVNTGRGLQVWWRAEETLLRDDADREKMRWVNAMLLKESRIESKDWKIDFLPDLPRLVRMPGTYNSKTGRIAYIDQVPKEGSEFISVWKAYEWAGDPPPKPEPPKLSNYEWQHALPHLSLTAKTFIMEGVDSKSPENPGRHHAAVAAARSLRDANIPYEGALVAVLRGAQRCRPSLDEDSSFTTYEVMRIVAGAYGIGSN